MYSDVILTCQLITNNTCIDKHMHAHTNACLHTHACIHVHVCVRARAPKAHIPGSSFFYWINVCFTECCTDLIFHFQAQSGKRFLCASFICRVFMQFTHQCNLKHSLHHFRCFMQLLWCVCVWADTTGSRAAKL